MATPALGEFDGVPVRIMRPHRAFPRLIMRRFKELNPSRFQLFVQRIEIICGQLDMNARALLRRCAHRTYQRIGDVVRKQPDRSARWGQHGSSRIAELC